MPTTINREKLLSLLKSIAEDMIDGKDELTELDAELGDGDLGRTVEWGFKGILEDLQNLDETDMGKALFKEGKVFSNAAPSSFGGLFGTMLMQIGKTLRGKEEAALSDLADGFQNALEALMERGKAKIGDKTMLDAINPAIEAMRGVIQDIGEDAPLGDFFRAAADAAQKGAEDTKELKSQIGRASWQGDRSAGKMDPGARAIAKVLDAAARHADDDKK